MNVAKPTAIPSWWRLPFAMALWVNAMLIRRCQLCTIHPIQKIADDSHHWFNQLSFLCQDCHQQITWQQQKFVLTTPTGDVSGIASVAYTYPYDEIIRQFKNAHQLNRLMLLVHAIRQLSKPNDCQANNSVIIPVPTTQKRLAKRGFDPVRWLSQYLSFYWQIPLFTQIERDERQHQQGLNRDQRLQNVANAFHLLDLPKVSHIILFDDVATTGATLQALLDELYDTAKTLNQNFQIHIRTLAHGG